MESRLTRQGLALKLANLPNHKPALCGQEGMEREGVARREQGKTLNEIQAAALISILKGLPGKMI